MIRIRRGDVIASGEHRFEHDIGAPILIDVFEIKIIVLDGSNLTQPRRRALRGDGVERLTAPANVDDRNV